MSITPDVLCQVCRHGSLSPCSKHKYFWPQGEQVEVALEYQTCSLCGATTESEENQRVNRSRLLARKPAYGWLWMSEEYLAARQPTGLSGLGMSDFLGLSDVSYFEYENEYRYPDEMTLAYIKAGYERLKADPSLADGFHKLGEPTPAPIMTALRNPNRK